MAGRSRLLVVLASILVLASPPLVAGEGVDPARIALDHLRGNVGAPDRFGLVYSAHYEMPVSGRRLWAGKFLDRQTGALRAVYVDGGRALTPADVGARERAELASLTAFERKADRALRETRASGQERLALSVWLAADTAAAVDAVFAAHPGLTRLGDRPDVADATLARTIRQELYDARAAVYARAEADAAALIRSLGGRPGYGSSSAPLLFAEIPATALDPLAQRPEVRSMGAADPGGWGETMSYAGPTVKADWAYAQGYRGSGVRVAVVEYYNVRATGDLSGKVVAYHNTASSSPAYDPVGLDHPSWVAGAIASQSSTYRGTAPAAGIVSSSTGGWTDNLAGDQAIIAAADWAIGAGDADIVNTSLGQDTSTGREQARKYFDAIVWEGSRVAVSAAGNYSTFGSWNIVSPGTGWNVLTVGGTDERNTTSWADDKLWYVSGSDGSCYVDPPGSAWNPHGDFNKPNVSAPAVSVRTANAQSATGTSVATPITAGVVAELVGRSGTFVNWPEIPRAVLMAGAIHHTPMPDGTVNRDHEGVGTVDAEWANRILNGSSYGGYTYGSLGPGGTSTSFPVAQGQNVRVALAWDSHTSGSDLSKTDVLTADLDLRVTFPDGVTRSSLSFDNSYEVVEYTSTATGTATIQVGATRFDASSEDFALAWVRWPTVADTQGPTTPGDFTASPTGPTSVALSWSPSTDDTGVAGYRISRNGNQVATVTGTSWSDSGLAPNTTYGYSVVAFDAVGNVSPAAATSATTPADTQSPTMPGDLLTSPTSTSSIALSWSPSGDDVGVAGYRISRDGQEVATVAGTSWTDGGLQASTTYGYSVVAFDAAGNVSGAATASATTPAPDTQPPTTPTLTALVTKGGTTKLTWTAASDDVAVAGYRVYREGTLYATTTGTSLSIRKIRGTFSYFVVAFDAAGNVGEPSNTVIVTVR